MPVKLNVKNQSYAKRCLEKVVIKQIQIQQRDLDQENAVTVDDDLCGLAWSDHVDHICNNVSHAFINFEALQISVQKNVGNCLFRYYQSPQVVWHHTLGKFSYTQTGKSVWVVNRTVRIVCKLELREFCRDDYKELMLLTLPCIYIY